MSATMHVDFDVRARAFVCQCTACGWTGRTTRLEVIAVPLAEHIKGCDGERYMRLQKTYNADAFDPNRHAPDPEPTPAPTPREPTGVKREKLTADQVREIRRRAAAGEYLRTIAAAFGVSVPNISSIVTRKSWKHVE